MGEYVIESIVAQGGCGIVYVARHDARPRRAAIKVRRSALASSPRMVERVVREVDLVNLLRHPRIVEIHELGQLADGRPYHAMELARQHLEDAAPRPGCAVAVSQAIDDRRAPLPRKTPARPLRLAEGASSRPRPPSPASPASTPPWNQTIWQCGSPPNNDLQKRLTRHLEKRTLQRS